MSAVVETGPQRRRIGVRGVVQGVGYRPFVFRLARELGLSGWVRNDPDGVSIEAQGNGAALDAFVARLRADAPPLARVIRVAERPSAARAGERGFEIVETGRGRSRTAIGPDSAVCPKCLSELFDPADRRWRYPFINCTECGPRFTLTRELPYDRGRTSMAAFALCDPCRIEYETPSDRRFHAEPNACPKCGPHLALLDGGGAPLAGEDPVAATLRRLHAGQIVAIKGLGGFHLACDARNAEAVARLRQRKQREEKPFAVMVAGLAPARRWAELDPEQARQLASPARPVVLARKAAGCDDGLAGVAPGLGWLGLTLPYTPLHYLLFHEHAGRPAGLDWVEQDHGLALVMTSANPGGEPLVTGNAEAVQRLHGIADALLVHDRDIVARCDDSVLHAWCNPDGGGSVQFVRRARGFAPNSIRLARAAPAVLALGGYLKNTACQTRGDEAFLSPHVGDLDGGAACQALIEAIAHLQRLLQTRPEAIACDLHPDFFSTRHAAELAAGLGVECIAVQHHHAHIGAVMAEHGLEGPVLGLALDGVGLGTDRRAWGGELLKVDGARMQRLGHLLEMPQPGGDRAAREPWRMAAAALHLLGRGDRIPERFAARPAAATVARMLEQRINSEGTSSMGRWFDAAAGLLGVRAKMAFEGQAAMLLEGLADGAGEADLLPGGWAVTGDRLDLLPLVASLAEEADPARGARRFHATLIAALDQWVAMAARSSGLQRVVFGGGCFLNRILSRGLRERLQARGLQVWEAAQSPPNDGGLSLGQAWVAQRALEEERCA
jgi:hydrogenase maturation protein HypF